MSVTLYQETKYDLSLNSDPLHCSLIFWGLICCRRHHNAAFKRPTMW